MTEPPAVERHWKVRGVAATLFGGAAVLYGSLLVFVDLDLALDISAYSVVAAAIVGFAAGPKLQYRARAQDDPAREALDGAVVTLVAYVIGALAMALRYASGVLDYVFVAVMALGAGLDFLLPATVLGGLAGWVFFRVSARRQWL